jgi:Transcriptional regulator PadR-like family
MLTLCILGFLYEEPLHAYELRSRISGLSGHIRPVSDGALYPAPPDYCVGARNPAAVPRPARCCP